MNCLPPTSVYVRAYVTLSLVLFCGGCHSFKKTPALVSDGTLLIKASAPQVLDASRLRLAGDDWRFLPLTGDANPAARAAEMSQWFIAVPSNQKVARQSKHPWDAAYQAFEHNTFARAFSGPIEIIEPNLDSGEMNPGLIEKPAKKAKSADPVFFTENQSFHWPKRDDVAWHLDDNYSQLRAARAFVEASGLHTNHVRVVVLDVGIFANHIAVPIGFNSTESKNLYDPGQPPSPDDSGHGTATTALLAGPLLNGIGPNGSQGWLGGSPHVEVIHHRIHDSVVHLFTDAMARGINLAVRQQADVVSISAGGLPSFAWVDAVDNAYTNGTAIFAASGDYLHWIIAHSPRWTVYPAAFNRVTSVAGITADKRTYAHSPNWFSWLTFHNFRSWSLRGNYGPRWKTTKTLAAYTPNVLWANQAPNALARDGAGTSAATPQVAAAAALWLQANQRDPLLAKDWRSWRKVEAVRNALFKSAETNLHSGARKLYFGWGALKARAALEETISDDMQQTPTESIDEYILLLIGDWFTPARSRRVSEMPPLSRMHALEALQLITTSVALQQRFDDPPKLTSSRNAQRALLIAIAKDSRCSFGLRQEIARVTAHK